MTTKILVKTALMLAMASVLQEVRLYHFPQGGAVTLGSMLPLILVSVSYGWRTGALAGFVFGIINLVQDPFILHPMQVLFDYPLPFMSMSIAGILGGRIYLATIFAFLCRFICHFISGAIFFASYAPSGMSPIIYSLTANASYLVPEMIITLLILKILPVQRIIDAMKG